MKADDLCTYHRDGWHRTLFRTTSLAQPPINASGVWEHTCVCWLPRPNHSGKITIESHDADDRWRWQGGQRIPLWE